MSSKNEEVFIIRLDGESGVISGMRSVGNEADKTKKKVGGINEAWGVFAKAAAAFSLYQIGGDIVDTLSKFEKFEAVLTNTLGSKSSAKKALDDITDFAAKTPFEVDNLTDSYVRLANQGFKPTIKEMTKIGDLAASKGKDLTQLSEAIIDAEVGEFERLKEFGVRAKKQGDQVSFTFKGVTKTVKFSDKAIRQYVLSLGEAEGVAGSMAAISKTTGGQISNLKDQVTQLYLNIGTKLKPVISQTIQVFSALIEKIGVFFNWLYSGSTSAEIFIAALYGIVGGLIAYKTYLAVTSGWLKIVTAAQWLWNAAMTANPIGIIIVAIGALIGLIVYLVSKVTGWGKAWDHTWKGAKFAFKAFVSNIKTMWTTLINGFMIGINFIMKGWYKFKNALGLGDSKENNDIIKKIEEDTEKRKQEIVDSVKETASLTSKALNEFKLAAGALSFKKKEKEEKEKEDFVNSKSTFKGDKQSTGKIGAGISEVKSSAPKIFNINIESLIKEQKIETTNLKEGSQKIKELVTNALLTAVNNAQIVSE